MRKIEVKCPYCGRMNSNYVTTESEETILMRCGFMEGGCGKFFVLDIKVTVNAKTRKVEGEDVFE